MVGGHVGGEHLYMGIEMEIGWRMEVNQNIVWKGKMWVLVFKRTNFLFIFFISSANVEHGNEREIKSVFHSSVPNMP